MEVKKVIMRDETEYNLLWDEEHNDEIFFNMIDLKKGWVKLNKQDVSQVFSKGELKNKRFPIHPKAKELIIENYGDFYLD